MEEHLQEQEASHHQLDNWKWINLRNKPRLCLSVYMTPKFNAFVAQEGGYFRDSLVLPFKIEEMVAIGDENVSPVKTWSCAKSSIPVSIKKHTKYKLHPHLTVRVKWFYNWYVKDIFCDLYLFHQEGKRHQYVLLHRSIKPPCKEPAKTYASQILPMMTKTHCYL